MNTHNSSTGSGALKVERDGDGNAPGAGVATWQLSVRKPPPGSRLLYKRQPETAVTKGQIGIIIGLHSPGPVIREDRASRPGEGPLLSGGNIHGNPDPVHLADPVPAPPRSRGVPQIRRRRLVRDPFHPDTPANSYTIISLIASETHHPQRTRPCETTTPPLAVSRPARRRATGSAGPGHPITRRDRAGRCHHHLRQHHHQWRLLRNPWPQRRRSPGRQRWPPPSARTWSGCTRRGWRGCRWVRCWTGRRWRITKIC